MYGKAFLGLVAAFFALYFGIKPGQPVYTYKFLDDYEAYKSGIVRRAKPANWAYEYSIYDTQEDFATVAKRVNKELKGWQFDDLSKGATPNHYAFSKDGAEVILASFDKPIPLTHIIVNRPLTSGIITQLQVLFFASDD